VKHLIILALSTVLLLSACEPVVDNYRYKSNVTVSQKDKDYFECDLASAQVVPANSQVGTTPMYVTPRQTSCYGYPCTTTGGQVLGDDVYSYDANANLRSDYYNRCLAAKGYSVVTLPLCPSTTVVPEQLKQTLMTQVRAPAEGACIIDVTNRVGNLLYANERG
jgi:hypothetical protein